MKLTLVRVGRQSKNNKDYHFWEDGVSILLLIAPAKYNWIFGVERLSLDIIHKNNKKMLKVERRQYAG